MEELKFEDAMKKLEEIANELENSDLSLDESVKNFKKEWIFQNNVKIHLIKQKNK